jgi:hypothetical protein
MAHPPSTAAPLPPQLWNLVRQRDATREAAVKLCQSRGQRVSRDLLATAPPPIAVCGEVKMTCEQRMRALGCMGRALVMHELAHGAGMPGALDTAAAKKSTAVMMKRDAAARAPSFHPCHPLPFSRHAEHTAPIVVLCPHRLTIKTTSDNGCSWARSEWGVDAGCGLVRWAVQLSQECAGCAFKLGVASDAFSEFTSIVPRQSWFFQHHCMYADGQRQGGYLNPFPFARGDVVTVELERAPGVDGVLRVRVAGKTPRELRGLPRDGMLYPIVGLCHSMQSMSMVVLP